MAARSDRAAAWTSGFEETDMTATASGVAPQIVSGTTPLPPASSSSGGGTLSSTANTTLAGNFQSFLTLLTTQLQNQDPLSPLDTNQFTQQLVQFASVEQELKTNDQLTTLVSLQQTAQSTQALTFVGKTAVVAGSTAALTNSSATWDLSVPTNSNVNISITSSTGQTAFSGNYAVNAGSSEPFIWGGKGNDGTQWPDGQYTMTATATDTAGNPVAVTTQIQGVVSSVDLTQSPPLLSINGQTYTVNQIQSIAG
jgi:flagellar basal-body rod modification protein FlgD